MITTTTVLTFAVYAAIVAYTLSYFGGWMYHRNVVKIMDEYTRECIPAVTDDPATLREKFMVTMVTGLGKNVARLHRARALLVLVLLVIAAILL